MTVSHALDDLHKANLVSIDQNTCLLTDLGAKKLKRATSPDAPFASQQRSSYFTYAPLNLPFDRMEQWYRAYQTFTRLTESPASQYRFKLQAGDFVLYDNYRMLHGRTAFSGARWMKGIYFDYPARHQATE